MTPEFPLGTVSVDNKTCLSAHKYTLWGNTLYEALLPSTYKCLIQKDPKRIELG